MRPTSCPGTFDYNAPVPVAAPSVNSAACLSAGETTPANGFNFDPCINASITSPNYTRPFTNLGSLTTRGLNAVTSYWGNSNYNSLQAGYRYQASKSLTLSIAYTYSRALSDVASRSAGPGGNEGSGSQNPRDFEAEYGPPGFDRPEMFNASYIYNLPLFSHRTDFAGKALGGWVFSGLTVFQSGAALSPGISGSLLPGEASRPNCIGTVAGARSADEFFNTSAFSAPEYGMYGNCGAGIIRGPGENNWSWSLYKTFPIGERLKLQFRSEFFNVFNHSNFFTLDTGLGDGSFGQVTSALDPREIEFALRVDF